MDWPEYVRVMSVLHDLPLDPERHAEVVKQLERIEVLARLVIEFPLEADIEPAPVFRP